MSVNGPLITIAITHFNDTDFVLNSLYCLARLTKNDYQVIIRDNNSKPENFERLKRGVAGYHRVDLYRVENLNLSFSQAHGTALDDLVSRITTPYGMIMDADCAVLRKNWDELLLSRLNGRVPIIGTQPGLLGNKPKDFPIVFALLFKMDVFKELKASFLPRDFKKLQDTGWELREKYLAAGYGGGLLFEYNTRLYKQGPFKGVICSEYYLGEGGGEPIFASHFGRGSDPKHKNLIRIAAQHNPIFRAINYTLGPLNQLKWRADKKRWLEICRQIVDRQT